MADHRFHFMRTTQSIVTRICRYMAITEDPTSFRQYSTGEEPLRNMIEERQPGAYVPIQQKHAHSVRVNRFVKYLLA